MTNAPPGPPSGNPPVIGHPPVLDLAVRTLDETELVDAGIDAQRRDQTDVRTFRRLDRADAAVMAAVHVAHFEAGALAAQPPGPSALRRRLCASSEADWSGP
jgi:hypothetical protein